MDRLEGMAVFAAVSDAQSFSKASRQLGLSPAAVTRAVAALEERLGVKLFHRTTRVVRLTESGARYREHVKRILQDVEESELGILQDHAELRGDLTLTAPVLFGRLCVAPVLFEFLERHQGVTIRALFADHVVDVLEQGIDVAVRIAHLPDSSLRAIRVGSVRRVVCASPSYLRAHGTPQVPSDLLKHKLIAFSGLSAPNAWAFSQRGKVENIVPKPRLVVNTGDLAIDAALRGHGMTRVLSYQVEQAVRAKRLRIVLSEYEAPPVPVHVIHAEGRTASARVRAFVDLTVERLRKTLKHVL